jgi:DNA recombination protein RmuC
VTFSAAIVVFALLGLAVGIAAAWLLMRSQATSLQERCSSAERECAVAQARLADQDERHRKAVETVAEQLKNELHEANSLLAQRNRDEFLDLASQRFQAAEERANAKLSELVGPVQQKLTEFDTYVKEIERQRVGAYEGLTEQIKQLSVHGDKLASTTSNLATQTSVLLTALRNPTTRGKWGEVQLRRVVELAGMEPYCDFSEQQTFESVDGATRPDMTVKLPGNSLIFVDAKVPLNAYLEAIEISDDIARREQIRQHAAAMKSHVDALARKNYQRSEGSADFVVMFVPGEAFLSAACIENPDLIEYGASKGIYIASPLTLMALLRSYALGWQQRRQEENARQIGALGRELYDAVRVFASHFSKIGIALEGAVSAYNSTVGSMEGRVLPRGRKLKETASLAEAELTEASAIETAIRPITALDAVAQPELELPKGE